MAQLGIRDKNYRPNQYINPMLISGGREPNPEDRPYRIFDKTNPEHPDYEGNKDDDDGPQFEQLKIPTVKGKTNQDMTIANARLPFINIDNLEDPVGTLRDGGYGDPDVMDFPSGGRYRKGSDVLDKLIDLELVKGKKNQDMTIANQIMDDPLSDFDITDKGLYMNYMGDMFMNLDGMLFPMGQGYDEGTHGKLVPKGLVQSMQINPDVAMFPRLSTGEPMTNIEKKQGLEVLRKTRDPKQIKLFIQQMMKGV